MHKSILLLLMVIIYHTTGQVQLYLDTDEEGQTARGLRSLLDAYLEEK